MDDNTQKKRRRVIALLTREEMEFLDKLGLDALFSAGSKLSRVDIISALVDAAMVSGVSTKDVKNKKELIQRILESTSTQPERRRYPRLKENLIVEFRKMDSMGRYKNATTDNIGMGGLRIDVAFLEESLSVNQVIEITIKDPKGKAEPVKTIGRIAWIKQKEDKHSYEIGLMLTYIKKEHRQQFLRYISEEVAERY